MIISLNDISNKDKIRNKNVFCYNVTLDKIKICYHDKSGSRKPKVNNLL